MTDYSTTAVIIPAYRPCSRIIGLVQALHEAGLKILVVNDGSGDAYKETFSNVSCYAHIENHPENRGKGAALKTGMRRLGEIYPECRAFITADADGQHLPEDILRVADALTTNGVVITVREREGHIPFRSRFGNDLSKGIYTLLTGRYYSDNQSGLRGFDCCHIEWLLAVGGYAYDYELSALYFADKQHIPVTVLPIRAVYIDNNADSHFNPVRDTLKIYRTLFSYAFPILLIFLLRELMAGLIFFTRSGFSPMLVLLEAGILSEMFAYVIEQGFVFKRMMKKTAANRDGLRMLGYAGIRFALIAGLLLLCSMFLPKLHLFAAYNILVLLFVPGEYYLRKLFCGKTR